MFTVAQETLALLLVIVMNELFIEYKKVVVEFVNHFVHKTSPEKSGDYFWRFVKSDILFSHTKQLFIFVTQEFRFGAIRRIHFAQT